MKENAETRPWLDLWNAMIIRAIHDYEILISEAPIKRDAGYDEYSMTIPHILEFLKGTEAEGWPKIIEKTYIEKFRPYAKRNARKIEEAWKDVRGLEGYARDMALKNFKYKCPLCGGALKPARICGVHVINCTGCMLNVKAPKRRKKNAVHGD